MFQLETNNSPPAQAVEGAAWSDVTNMARVWLIGWLIRSPLNNVCSDRHVWNGMGGNIWMHENFVTKLHQLLKSAFGYKESNFVKLKFIDDWS